jgi:hypothetical protein
MEINFRLKAHKLKYLYLKKQIELLGGVPERANYIKRQDTAAHTKIFNLTQPDHLRNEIMNLKKIRDYITYFEISNDI